MQDEQGKPTTIDASELPFLVTHWLSNFQASSSSNSNSNSNINQEALQRIHQAAADMASAFSDLGAFGTANQVSLNPDCVPAFVVLSCIRLEYLQQYNNQGLIASNRIRVALRYDEYTTLRALLASLTTIFFLLLFYNTASTKEITRHSIWKDTWSEPCDLQ